ncbi:MAG: arginine--tRNA ligase [Alcaligenaceae bacterium]|uniref:arginine--tRNA ligase n=1 Tax=Paenalcaligenes sp. TaxID=1966342 RepID=UPI0016B0802B|nr:arginine--tRNA ligase [Paenalcaligenes sp.]NLJ62597.1 arginine--tRNA ligase [Alcaligenaceae bacterium]
MLAQQQQQLSACIQAAVQSLVPDANPSIVLERPKVAAHGDVATNVAMQLARPAKRNPRELAQSIVDFILADASMKDLISSAEIAGPGFINFRLTPAAHQAVLPEVFTQGNAFGNQPATQQKLMVEFVSANPTGPLHVGHARQAALGDALCRLFSSQGFEVSREFYYNDAGNQIDNLAISVQARAQGIAPDSPEFPADGYKGDYIMDIARAFLAKETVSAADGEPVTASGDIQNLDDIRRFAVTYLRHEQDLDLKAFNLVFDNYYLESSLYTDGRVDAVVKALTEAGHTYEADGALWLRTTELNTGDDKDRVMRKREGGYTYFVPDVAYHVSKWERGFHHAINIQGTDHHGTIARVRAGLQGLNMGIPADYPAYVLHSMVKVMRGGEEVKISKRAGSYVTLRDLVDWVGLDAVRFFLVQRRADSDFVFDIDLALSKSEENPVYYIQYAHARAHSVLKQTALSKQALAEADFSLLTAPSEIKLLQRLAEYPAMLSQAAKDLAAHQVAFWLRDCAADFHAWYNSERVMVENTALKTARAALTAATAQVIANGLDKLGVSAPKTM